MSDTFHRAPDEEALTRLFDRASPRPRPRASAEAAAFEALHGEWRQVVRQRRRRRAAVGFALAASVLLGIGVVAVVATRPDGVQVGSAVAAVGRVEGGQVILLDESARARPITAEADELFAGQRLSTGADSRVALAWHGGGSLRLDEHARIDLVSDKSVRLVAGNLYFDSAAMESDAAVPPAPLSILTPAGEVLHIGTQFMMRVEGEQVVLSVREGRVKVTGAGFELVVSPGEQLDVDVAGPRARRAIPSYDESWTWARDIAPREPTEGRTAFDILAWVARETGRRLEYASGSAETLARQTVIRGLGERAPEDALAILPYFTDLEYEVRADAIVLSAR